MLKSTNYRTKRPQITEQNRHKLPNLHKTFGSLKKKVLPLQPQIQILMAYKSKSNL